MMKSMKRMVLTGATVMVMMSLITPAIGYGLGGEADLEDAIVDADYSCYVEWVGVGYGDEIVWKRVLLCPSS